MATIELGALPLDALRGVSVAELQPGDLLNARGGWWWVLENNLLQLTSEHPDRPAFRLFPRFIDQDELYSVVRLPGPPALHPLSEIIGGAQNAAGTIAVTHGGVRVVAVENGGMQRLHLLNLADWTLTPRNAVTASGAIEHWELVWRSGQGTMLTLRHPPL